MEFYYHDGSPPAQAILMLMNQLGVKYVPKYLDILFKMEHTTEEFLKINPFGKVPAIKEGDFCLGESRPIGIYLCETYEPADKPQKLYPTDLKQRALVNRALWIDTNNWSKMYGFVHLRKMFLQGVGLDDSLKPAFYEALDSLELLLSQAKFLALDYPTIADIFTLTSVKLIDFIRFKDWHMYPRLAKWKEEMEKQPFYEESVGKFVRKYASHLLESDRYLDCSSA